MAVWVFAYGKNNLIEEIGEDDASYLRILNSLELDGIRILDSLLEAKSSLTHVSEKAMSSNDSKSFDWFDSMSDEKYEEYLKSISAPLMPRSELDAYFQKKGEDSQKEKELSFKKAYSGLKSGSLKAVWEKVADSYFTYIISGISEYDTIRFQRINDLIWVTGPWGIFSVYGRAQSVISPESLDFYHDSFKRIMLAFDSDFIVYGHEWSPVCGSDDNNDFNSNDLMRQIRSAGKSSDSIHTMKDFYFEQLST